VKTNDISSTNSNFVSVQPTKQQMLDATVNFSTPSQATDLETYVGDVELGRSQLIP
jgi:hypothetical protein